VTLRALLATWGHPVEWDRLQIWVPDVRSPQFGAEAHRQSALVAAADRDSDDMDFLEAMSVDWGE
jgi:hypothetical protein